MKIYLLLPFLLMLCAFSFKTNVHPTPKTYTSAQPAFSFEYAGNAILYTENLDNPKIVFPVWDKESNLHEKYLEIIVKQGATNCPDASEYAAGTVPKNVTINGINFQKWVNSDAGAGNLYETEEYVTQKNGFCIRLRFTFHSVQPQNYDNPPALYQRRKEGVFIKEVMSSIKM